MYVPSLPPSLPLFPSTLYLPLMDEQTPPQPQQQFSFSSSYASSPLSTPSRTLNYSVPSSSSQSPSLSQSRSFTFSPTSPSSRRDSLGSGAAGVGAGSPLAAYRGRHVDRVGREFCSVLFFPFLAFVTLSFHPGMYTPNFFSPPPSLSLILFFLFSTPQPKSPLTHTLLPFFFFFFVRSFG